jgi:hypothetical protein
VKDLLGAVSNVATVTVDVTGPPNAPPVARNDSANIFTAFQSRVTIHVLKNDTDPQGKATIAGNTLTVVTPPAHGTVTRFQTAGGVWKFRYRPNAGFVGTDTFRYRVADTLGAVSNAATVTISVSP